VGCAGFECAVSVCHGAVGVVVEMRFDITAYDTSEGTDEIVQLSWGCASYGVGDTDAVDADFADGGADGEENDDVGAKRVFGSKADLNPFVFLIFLDELDDFDGGVANVGHVFAVGVFV